MGAANQAGAVTPLSADDGASPEKASERFDTLEEGEGRTRAFEQYVQTLGEETEQPERIRVDKSRASCGLGCGAGKDPKMAREFARVVQDMIRRISSHPQSLGERLRVFDNRRMTFDIEGGLLATFTESRSTGFRRLRAAVGFTDEDYLASMCDQPMTGGETDKAGKSGSLFLRSHDGRLVLKTIEEHEFDTLNEILPNYLLYLEENTNSLLCRFFAAYKLSVHNVTLRFVVMDNVLPQPPLEVYDLKGTTEDRWADPMVCKVLKDNNFRSKRVLLEAGKRRSLVRSLQDDAEFLESLGLMDYSLLVGVTDEAKGAAAAAYSRCPLKVVHGQMLNGDGNPQKRAFQLGVIDYLQRWTHKKVAAHWLKKPTLGCCHEIDTEPPQKYCSRFYKYVDAKFQVIGQEMFLPSTNGSGRKKSPIG